MFGFKFGLSVFALLSSSPPVGLAQVDSRVYTLEVRGADFLCSHAEVVAHNTSSGRGSTDSTSEVQWIGDLNHETLGELIQNSQRLNPMHDPAVARSLAQKLAASLTSDFLTQYEGMFVRVVGETPIAYTSDRSSFESWTRARRLRGRVVVYRTIYIRRGKPTVLYEPFYGESADLKDTPLASSFLSAPVFLVDLKGKFLQEAIAFARATRSKGPRLQQAISGAENMDLDLSTFLCARYPGKRLLFIASLPYAVTEDNPGSASTAMSALGKKRGFEVKAARITPDGFEFMDGTTPKLIAPARK